MKTLPSSEAEAMTRSLKGFLALLLARVLSRLLLLFLAGAHQSVSRTVAVWPRNRGIWSGTLPLSSTGMTAKAPPPDASQLTDRYSGLAC